MKTASNLLEWMIKEGGKKGWPEGVGKDDQQVVLRRDGQRGSEWMVEEGGVRMDVRGGENGWSKT